MSSEAVQQTLNFQHRTQDGCDCPIHRHEDREPFTAPLGMEFADSVSVEPIPRQTAARIYEAHHSYKTDLPEINQTHHGIFYQNKLMGAITYRFGLGGKRAIRWDSEGELLARVYSDSDYDNLPDSIRPLAREIVPDVEKEDIATQEVLSGDKFLEAARICLGVSFPNLASAGLARSQDEIINSYCRDNGVQFLFTFVRADFPGSMIRALRDRGWTCTGWAEPSTTSNRKEMEIRKKYKWRFLAPIEDLTGQATIDNWD